MPWYVRLATFTPFEVKAAFAAADMFFVASPHVTPTTTVPLAKPSRYLTKAGDAEATLLVLNCVRLRAMQVTGSRTTV